MTIITCPFCRRDGSSKATVPIGTKIRCPGCNQKFRYDGPTSAHARPMASVADADQAVLDADLDFARLDVILDEPAQPAPVPAPQSSDGTPHAPLGPMEVIVVG